MLVLGKFDRVDLAAAVERHAGGESVRLRDFADGFEIAVSFRHGEDLARAVATHGLDGDVIGTQRIARGGEPKARRHAVFEYLKGHWADTGLQVAGLIMV